MIGITLLITDGVGARNFLLGAFLPSLAAKGRVHVLHRLPPSAREMVSARAEIEWEQLIGPKETPARFFLRNALVSAHMYRADTMAMRFNLRLPVNGSWRTRYGVRAARMVGRAASLSVRAVAALDHLHGGLLRMGGEVDHYRQLLKRFGSRVLFCSHQRPPSVIPAVLAARSLRIPTATFIFSWDNLTSKGRIAAPFDYYFVWSALMRDELLRYYPQLPPARVEIVGTPQFDPYADEALLWSREEFFRRIGADPRRPLICYSGGDVTIAPEDAEHVGVLLELIRAGRIKRAPQVLLRPSPVDDGKRYAEVRARYPELIYAVPSWIRQDASDWASACPTPSDVQFLANLTRYADLNVNVSSTMTLDFAIHDKPVVNIAFDVASPPPFGLPLWEHHYRFEHYRPVIELGAARFARSPDELAAHINAYLSDPTLDREGRQKLVELEVMLPLGCAGERISQAVMRIAAEGEREEGP